MTKRPASFQVCMTFEGEDAADIDAMVKRGKSNRRAVVRSIVLEVLADDRLEHQRPPQGYYGCKMPPGACGCPQSSRETCGNSHWVGKSAAEQQRGKAA